jgi:hypothetical protein
MPERVTNLRLEWEFSQCSLSVMGHHSSPIRKVSAKRFPPEMVGQPEIGQKTFLVSLDFPAGRGTLLAHCAIEKAGIHQPNGNERLFGRYTG